MSASPPPFSPITDREQLGWQRRAAGVLAGLLERAHRDRLPVVTWSVSDAGARLVARCLAHDPAGRRADFDAWCQALDGTRREVRQGATTHLYAEARHYDGLVSVAVLADLFDQDEPPGASEPDRPASQGRRADAADLLRPQAFTPDEDGGEPR